MSRTVVLAHRCFWPGCKKGLGAMSSAQHLRKHLASAHRFDIPSPFKIEGRRRSSKRVAFTVLGTTRSLEGIEHSLACAFCENYDQSCEAMYSHTRVSHAQFWPASDSNSPGSVEAAGDSDEGDEGDEGDDGEKDVVEHGIEQHRGRKRREPSSGAIINIAGIDLTPPAPDTQRFIVGDLDVTAMMHQARSTIKSHKWKLPLESNLPLALALSHILLLIPGESAIGIEQSDAGAIVEHIKEAYDIKEPPMPYSLLVDLIKIAEDMRLDKIKPADAAVRFAHLSVPLSDHERKVVKAIGLFADRLPDISARYPISEATLAQFYAAPLLDSLFIDRGRQVVIYYTNTKPLEVSSKEDAFLGRPDLCIQRNQGAHVHITHGYGEIKPSEASNRYSIAMDLHRIGILCARAQRQHGTRGAMGVQVAGFKADFYITVNPAPSVQVMMQFATVNIPRCFREIKTLITELPTLLMILSVFDSCCLAPKHVKSSSTLSSTAASLPIATSAVELPHCPTPSIDSPCSTASIDSPCSLSTAESSDSSSASLSSIVVTPLAPPSSPPLLSERAFAQIFSTVRNKRSKCVVGGTQH
ncbi:hypothetical protein BC940DRAFT_313773 [Gongronella butleri]|nr:hypothetical protein BC940DRAFT_313773 [Gongronella butleri]